MDDYLDLTADMSDHQRALFQAEFQSVRKNPTTALVFTLFLGGLGAHRFYLGQAGLGIVYVLFCWTLIPALVAVIELFLIGDRTRAYNAERAREIASRVRRLSPGATSTASG